jgi:UDP-galactopyranose mutase
MGYRFGKLPYRTLDFVFETKNVDSYQSRATVNYTVSEDFTRITEFKKMTLQKIDGVTTIMKEYPRQYEGKEGEIPYYPVANPESAELYAKYREEAGKYGLILLGRLAEYKYYNMDAVVKRAMELLGEL